MNNPAIHLEKEGGGHAHTHTNTHKSCIMIFTCATPLKLLGRNLLDHAGMFSFKLMVEKKGSARERERWGEGLKVMLKSGRT